ncbi:MAG: GIY-YIG nuclease family protein [Oleiphilaceae bacterium]|nr:GIY-YIG nuclease family protein [Oleiphilaceae bacterium]
MPSDCMPSDWSLYMLRTASGALYTGITTDVQRRLQEHRKGVRGARALRGRGLCSWLMCGRWRIVVRRCAWSGASSS